MVFSPEQSFGNTQFCLSARAQQKPGLFNLSEAWATCPAPETNQQRKWIPSGGGGASQPLSLTTGSRGRWLKAELTRMCQ